MHAVGSLPPASGHAAQLAVEALQALLKEAEMQGVVTGNLRLRANGFLSSNGHVAYVWYDTEN